MRFALTGAGVARLRDSEDRIVITGASGWLGLATLDLLAGLLGPDRFAARVTCYGSQARTLGLRSGMTVAQQPLAALAALDRCPTIVLHNAFLTKDRAETMSEADYVAANRAISASVLGTLSAIGTHALFVPSSGAARFADDPAATPAMRLYGQLKRDDEDRFAGWAAAHGATAAIVRVFNIAGPYINKHGAYALASFILSAQAGTPIAVAAPRPVYRAYAAIDELMSIVFALVTSGDGAVTRVDSGGAPALEMLAVAQAVARVVRDVPVTRAAIDPARGADNYFGDPAPYAALRERFGVMPVDFDTQIAVTAADLAHAGQVRTI